MSELKNKAIAAVAAGLGVSAVVVAGIWAGYRGQELAAGHPDPEAIAEAEPEHLLAAVVDLGQGPRVVEMRAKRSYLRAGQEVVIPQLGRGIVVKACGTVKQRVKRCPDEFPPADRCACCGHTPGTDCVGGTLCRYGRGGSGDEACDPDAPSCAPWPCWVPWLIGYGPEKFAAEDEPDAGSDGGA